MPKHRFYLSPADWSRDQPELRDEEARHCRDVMRCGSGDVVTVFDGKGREAGATILAAAKKSVSLEIGEELRNDPLPAKITLGQAIPKGKSMELIIQKATELGVCRVAPLLTTHTVVRLSDRDIAKKQEKWQRVAIEACKQCGQNWLPEIAAPRTVESFIRETTDDFRIVAAIGPRSLPLKKIMAQWDETRPSRPEAATLLIGPEGDFTAEEVDAAVASGFQPMSLGPIILRSETAAIYSLSVLAYELMGR